MATEVGANARKPYRLTGDNFFARPAQATAEARAQVVDTTPSKVESATPEQDDQGCCGYLFSLLSSLCTRISDFVCSLFSYFRSSPVEAEAPPLRINITDAAGATRPAALPTPKKEPLALQQIDQAVDQMKLGINIYFKLILVARLFFESEAEPEILGFTSQIYPSYTLGDENNPREQDLEAFAEAISKASQGKRITDFIFSCIGMQKERGRDSCNSILVHNYFFSNAKDGKVESDGGTGLSVSHESEVFTRFKEYLPRFYHTHRSCVDEDEQARANQAYQKALEAHQKSAIAWQFLQTHVTEEDFALS